MKTTDELLKILNESKNIESYLSENSQSFINAELRDYLETIMNKNGLTIPEVIRGANLSQIYVYKIMSGERIPGRDKLLCLCFGLKMNLKETQLALRLAGHSLLYPRVKRDSIIIFAINEKADLMECNETLYDLKEDILE